MATRFYLPASAASTPITPTPDAAWENTSILARAMTSTSPISDAMTTVSFAEGTNTANQDILFRQHVSAELSAGQTITGSQALKAQVRVAQTNDNNNLVLAVGIRVLNGTTVQKTVLAVTRDALEANLSTLENRQFTATSAATDYTTVAGDRLVIETGMGGTPGIASDHDSSMRFGDAAASDLPENNTATTDDNPWVELTDTLTFGGSFAPALSAALTPFSVPVLPAAAMLPY